MRPDPRSEPVDFASFVSDAYRDYSRAYHAGRMTEPVYRASLHALGWRGADISIECRMNAPDPKPAPKEKYKVIGGTVVRTP